MKTKELIVLLKRMPQEVDIYLDDGKGGLIDIEAPKIYSERQLKRVRPDLKAPVVVLSDY